MGNRYLAILTVFVALSLACSICTFPPAPSKQSVTRNDVAGVYEYKYEGNTTTVYLNSDGTFRVMNSSKLAGEGKWFLDGSYLVLIYDGKETEFRPGWYVSESFGKLEIMGGEGDADYWYFFKKVTP